MKRVFLKMIRFYQVAISPYKPPTCRFFPTCSEYGYEAITRFGAFRGGYLTLRRILKCHPFHPGGVDLVPGSELEAELKALSARNNEH